MNAGSIQDHDKISYGQSSWDKMRPNRNVHLKLPKRLVHFWGQKEEVEDLVSSHPTFLVSAGPEIGKNSILIHIL